MRIGRKGKLNSIDSMQSNQSNSTLGHKGRVPKKDVKSIAFVMKDGEGTFFKYTNTDKSKRPVHPKSRHYMFVKLIYFCYQVDLQLKSWGETSRRQNQVLPRSEYISIFSSMFQFFLQRFNFFFNVSIFSSKRQFSPVGAILLRSMSSLPILSSFISI